MRSVSPFVTFLSYKPLCDRLEKAARKSPVPGSDPIHCFIEAAARGDAIDWQACGAVAERMEELAKDWPSLGELVHPTIRLAHRLRSAASAEIPFPTCEAERRLA